MHLLNEQEDFEDLFYKKINYIKKIILSLEKNSIIHLDNKNNYNSEKTSAKQITNNSHTLDVSGLDKTDIKEIQEQINYKKWKKEQSNEKNQESKNA